MTVKLKYGNIEYNDLTPGQSYVVIGIEADDYRILNDQGRHPIFTPTIYSKLTFLMSQAIGLPRLVTMASGIPIPQR
jgi:hypothetical protein